MGDDLRAEVSSLRSEQRSQAESLGALYTHVQQLERRLNERVDGAEARLRAELANIRRGQEDIRRGQEAQMDALAALLQRTGTASMPEAERRRQFLKDNRPHATAKQEGYTCAELRNAEYTCQEAKAVGFSLREMKQVGYTCQEAKAAGFSLQEMRQVGFTCQEAATARFSLQEMRQVGYTCQEAKSAGFSLQQMRYGGYTCQEAKTAGLGFSPTECMKAGFTWQEGKAAGFHPFANGTGWNDRDKQRCWEKGGYGW